MSRTRLTYAHGVQETAIGSDLGTLALAINSYRTLRNARGGPSVDAHADQQPSAGPNQPPSEMRNHNGR